MGDTSQISLYTLRSSYQYHRSTLIFFITGNPGLIEFYTKYLNTLHGLLLPESNAQQSQIHIYGQSMAGFSDDQTSLKGEPYSLEDQIQILEGSLNNLCTSSETQGTPAYDNVILMGHSVGSYILLELIRRFRKSSSAVTINAGILLFPTVTHIAQSPSGIKISRLFQWRDSPRRVGRTLQKIFSLFPRVIVRWLVRAVTGMSKDFTAVVTKFLVSRIGIWQAL
jgi:pimeloyl-ACP methyl ester carboxylesterase